MSLAVAAPTRCAHCGEPATTEFCCAGCRTAHDILVGAGLEQYYALADGAVAPVKPTGHSYSELDDRDFLTRNAEPRPGGLFAIALLLENVHCAACVWLTERLPHVLPGVTELRLDVGRARADVVFDPARVQLSAVARFLDSIGYPVHPYRGTDRDAVRDRGDRALLIKLGVAGAAMGNVMLIAAALYAGMFTDMAYGETRFFRWVTMIVTVPAVAFAAQPFFRGAWAALRSRAVHLDVPISLGILVACVWGVVNVVRGAGEIYFDSIAMLVFFLLVARVIHARQQRRAASAAELLIALIPSSARRLDGDDVVTVPVAALARGDVIELRAGDTAPVDGLVIDGVSAMDLALLTGESRPVDVAVGDEIAAGTVNLGGRLLVRATATGEATRLGRITATVEDLARRRAPIVRFADRVAARFTAVVITVAALTVLGWWVGGHGGAGLEHAMALLVVTCPCALGLATPMTFAFTIGRAARRGVLVKGGDALERLARPGRILLDKTGTLTSGELTLVEWCGDREARPLVRAVERASAHPLARALVAGVGVVPALEAHDVRETTGGGIEGRVDGHAVVVGSPAFVAARVGGLGAMAAHVERLAGAGITPVVVAVDGAATAVAGLSDTLRPGARATVDRLRAAGWSVAILSGDDPLVVTAVARELGLDPAECQGGVTPEGKLSAVQRALAHGPVVMVGDGVNDAAALAAATCGIAIHGGAEAAAGIADVVITGRAGDRLGPLAELIEGARTTLRVVHRNLAISLAYNLAGATLAVAGIIHPLIAAVAMPVSSISVLTSAASSRAFRSRR